MEIRIEKLSPSNKEAFFSLFETNSFEHKKEWKSCYCRFYHTSCSYDDWIKRTSGYNKAEASVAIDEGKMCGFLAFTEDKCIGWINSGEITMYPRLYPLIDEEIKKKRTALSICFVIHEMYRGQKVASSLLDYAIEYHRNQGIEMMIAVPIEVSSQELNYRGPKEMYLHRNYQEFTTNDQVSYMILKL